MLVQHRFKPYPGTVCSGGLPFLVVEDDYSAIDITGIKACRIRIRGDVDWNGYLLVFIGVESWNWLLV